MADELHRLSAEEFSIVQAYRHASPEHREQLCFLARCVERPGVENASALERWHFEVNRFMRDVKKREGIDYHVSGLQDALDAEVKALASKPENEDKTARWFLVEAHKTVKQKLRIKSPANVVRIVVNNERAPR